MPNDATAAPARATTGQEASPGRRPIAVEEPATAPRRQYSAEQLETILEVLAGRLSTLTKVLTVLQMSGDDEWQSGILIDAAQAIAVSLGAMADSAVGGGIIGNADLWHYGPNFRSKA